MGCSGVSPFAYITIMPQPSRVCKPKPCEPSHILHMGSKYPLVIVPLGGIRKCLSKLTAPLSDSTQGKLLVHLGFQGFQAGGIRRAGVH